MQNISGEQITPSKTRNAVSSSTETKKLQLRIGGMACSFCVASITKALGRMDGVSNVNVNLAHEETLVEYTPSIVTPSELKDTLRELGYTIRDTNKVKAYEEQEAELLQQRRDLFFAAGLALISLVAMTLMWLEQLSPRGMAALYWLMPVLALATVFGPGWHILTMAWASLRRGILNQHVLLEFGALSGLIGGFLGYVYAAFPVPDFFGVSVFVTTYHLLSGYVSLLVRTRASQAVRKLLELAPATACVVHNGVEAIVPIEKIIPGNMVRVRPGESIPVDGVVVEGSSGVDESLVTGESMPAEKTQGDAVIGGSIVQFGTLVVRVAKVGEESFLSQVARQVEEARALKPGLLALVDRILQIYVPAVLLFAAAAVFIWTAGAWWVTGSADWTRAIFAALAVLVMGYPCSLGMATPLAMIRGGGMAAERGILMRSAEAFHVLKDVRKIILDKTGTITLGKPAVTEIVVMEGHEETETLRLAAAVESVSEHPLARAVVAAAEAAQIGVSKPQNFLAAPGRGVAAMVEGRHVCVGSPAYVESRNISIESARERLASMQEAGFTVIAVAVDGQLAGLIAIADQIKPDAAEAIERLRAAGLEPVMLTGDNQRTARAVANRLGIKEFQAEVLPEDKANAVRVLQRQGYRVAFVGDGINDSPALMQADVGIAIGAGTDIAIESADVVLVGQRLAAVADAFQIGKASYRKTVQNLTLAFSFNAIGVPLAVTGLVHPVWAMIAMATSVTTVLTNSFAGKLLPAAKRRDSRVSVTVTYTIANMHCEHCVDSIAEAALKLDGVEKVTGDAARKLVTVTYHADQVDAERIRAAIVMRGFEVSPDDRNFVSI